MKIIKLEQAEKSNNSEKCKVLEYGFKDKDIDCTTAVINGRYPDIGYCMNEECKELNINYSLVSVYPWENVKEELKELNNE